MLKEQQSTNTLRAQATILLAQARAQAAEVQRALQAAGGNGPLHSELSGMGSQLSGAIGDLEMVLQSPASSMRNIDLQAIRSLVQSGAVSTLVSQASAQASAQAAAQTVAARAAETRTETQSIARDVFERKIFEPYLRFSSKEDEAEYRKREAEARKYIDAQLAKRTPEGDLNASGGMIGQMLDAHTHGAGNSPDFMPRWNALEDKAERQHAAMRTAGQSTAEFDQHLEAAARRFLKAKGLSDAEIDAKLGDGKDPLAVLKPYLGDGHTNRQVTETLGTSAPGQMVALEESPGAAPTKSTVNSIAAGLKAAGVQLSENTPTSKDGHGLPGIVGEKNGTSLSIPT